ncbi:hypothetical protein H2204_002552 [Knufia peltigerae]|uniref:Major facilitator superfamily (MFS) profile domain-containing protein n=1 Tax=Knufia peltigerae TaxID=1002370 RepID=A0AA38YAY4_9EURO|nr:hypothetical protein H2204_002552 [Knufia peltigerae]
MARFYGLRGHKLNRLMLFTVVGPAFLLLGYNNACAGGLLNLPDWVETFPQINTVSTTGRRAAHNSTIQGTAVASYTLGCFMGAFSCIFVGNKIGQSLAFLQLCGVNAISFYIGPTIELDLALSGRIASILGASVFTWQTLCSLIAVYTIDRLGRRKLMLFSAIGMGCCMAIAAGTASYPDNCAAIIVAGICLFMFSFFFPIGFLGLPFLYSAEVAPVRARVLITAISTSTTWILNFMIAEVTPVGFSHIHARYFVIYACMNFGLILPRGRSLEEIDELFAASTVFNVVKNSKVSGGGVDVPLEQQPERIGKVPEEMVETRNNL